LSTDHDLSPKAVISYDPHSSIFIYSDDDLNATAVGEGWAGDGSSEFPFLIQGYEIDDDEELIHIEDTRYHFKILDCNLTYALYAVYLYNVTNCVIENCLIDIPYNGIFMENVTGIDVIGCNITVHPDAGFNGIRMSHAIDCSIEGCIIEGTSGSDAGIFGEFCDGITISETTIFEFDNHGIFFGASYNIDLLYNTIYWNEGVGISPTCGIYLVEGTFANIEGNNITQNSDNGITIESFFNVTIVGNYIYENWIHGIYVDWSDFCVIEDNYIGYNGEGTGSGPMCGISTYYSHYIEVIGNEFWWNAQNSITLGFSNFARISNNYINHSYDNGIWITMSHNATVEENEIYNSDGLGGSVGCGFRVEWSNHTSLIDNTIGFNSENGITIYSSHEGELIGNAIFDSEFDGLYMADSTGWDISYNVIYDNGGPGIVMDDVTYKNNIYYNDIGWSGEYLVVDNWGGNYWNKSGVGNWYSDYNGTGSYSIFGIADEIDYYPSMSLYIGTTTPSEYEVGTTGNTMTWAASALNPGTHELLIDGVSQGHVTWDGGPVAADVDGLAVGVYNVTLIVYHVSGHWLANQSTLTVVDTMAPTWIQTPQDQTLEYNVPLSYQLQASDPSGIASWAVNDTLNFAISSGGLLTNATFLEPGVYYVEITVTDVYSHSTSITIMITVSEPSVPLDPVMIMLAVGGVGAAVIIGLIVILSKKKGS